MENYDQPWKQLNLSANASAEEPAHDTPLVSEDVPTLTKNNRYSLSSFTQCHTHVLRHLFIDKPTSTRSLRVRVHNFIFPLKTTGTLYLGQFTSALLWIPCSSPAYFANWLFRRLTILIFLVYGLFHAPVNPSAFVSEVV